MRRSKKGPFVALAVLNQTVASGQGGVGTTLGRYPEARIKRGPFQTEIDAMCTQEYAGEELNPRIFDMYPYLARALYVPQE
jgi:hypothetical protein